MSTRSPASASTASTRVLELDLQAALLGEVPKRFETLRLWRRQVGMAEVRGRVVRFGVPGQADLHGFDDEGRAYEVELKGVGGRLSDEQVRWCAFCRGMKVRYALLQARKDETMQQTIDRWVQELRTLVEYGAP